MSHAYMRIVVAAIGLVGLILSINPTLAQGSEPKAGGQRQPGNEGEVRKKTDVFTEAARVLSGPVSTPECVDLGWKTLVLLKNDDLDTAFRHMELYDRFGCPFGHIQAAYRCVLLQDSADKAAADKAAAEKAQGGTDKTQGAPEKIDVKARAQACWVNPTTEPVPPPTAEVPSTTTNR